MSEDKAKYGYADGIDDKVSLSDLGKLIIHIRKLELRIEALEENEKWKGPNG